MKYSVIIPTRLSIKTLVDCLHRLKETLPKDDAEVIVVGNGTEEERRVTKATVHGLQEIMKVHYTESTLNGFTPACNKGAELAKGDTLIFLNDDAFPSLQWLFIYEHAVEYITNTFPKIKIGCIGPVSNYALSTQMINTNVFPYAKTITAVDYTQQELINAVAKNNSKIVHPASNLSGFCLFVNRTQFKTVGGFRSFGGLGGYEDNDLCLRISRLGYTHFIAKQLFVFHHGHATLSVLAPETMGGVTYGPNYLIQCEEEKIKKTQELCITYRVQINTERDLHIFLKSLAKSLTIANYVIILNDRSSLDIVTPTYTLSEQIQECAPIVWKHKGVEEGFDEAGDRQQLLDLARADGCDWIWNLDHDEVIIPEVTKEMIQALMDPVDPRIAAYSMPIRTYWRSRDKIRVDGIWGQMRLQTFYRSDLRYGDILSLRGSKFHCTRYPCLIPEESVLLTNRVVIEHYGYENYEEQAKVKHGYYEAMDDVKDPALVGGENYNHLIDEKTLSLVPFVRPRVCLAVMCKNESRRMANLLSRYSTFFSGGVVVQDNGSTDETLDFLKTFGIPTIHFKCCDHYADDDHMLCDFSAARNNLLDYIKSNTDAEYILVLDPDEDIDYPTEKMFDHIFYDEADAYMCTVMNYRYTANKSLESYAQIAFRLFRATPKIYYQRATHETIEQSMLAYDGIVVETETKNWFTIKHYGYIETPPQDREKRNAAYAKRLETMAEEDPTDGVVLLALAIHYNTIGEHDRGTEFLRLALAANPKYWMARYELIHSCMRSAIMLLANIPEGGAPGVNSPEARKAEAIARSLLQWFPDLEQAAQFNV